MALALDPCVRSGVDEIGEAMMPRRMHVVVVAWVAAMLVGFVMELA